MLTPTTLQTQRKSFASRGRHFRPARKPAPHTRAGCPTKRLSGYPQPRCLREKRLSRASGFLAQTLEYRAPLFRTSGLGRRALQGREMARPVCGQNCWVFPGLAVDCLEIRPPRRAPDQGALSSRKRRDRCSPRPHPCFFSSVGRRHGGRQRTCTVMRGSPVLGTVHRLRERLQICL